MKPLIHTLSLNGLAKLQIAIIGMSMSTFALADIAQSPLFLTATVKPNIMLMIDDSGSMKTELAVTPTPFDPLVTYLENTNCAVNPLTAVTLLDTSSKCKSAGYKWKNGACSVASITQSFGATIPTNFFGNVTGSKKNKVTGTQCFSSTISYTTSIAIPSGQTTDAQRANYLNWYYSNEIAKSQGSNQTRLEVAKAAGTALVNSLDDTVRLGLSTLTTNDGGALLEEITDLTDAKKTAINTKINNLSADTYTPLAETLSDIGSYFAKGYTGDLKLHPNGTSTNVSVDNTFNNNTIVNSTGNNALASPVQYACQRNFAILVTDGQPTKDRSISSSLADYDGDCANNSDGHCKNVCDGSTTVHYDMKAAYPYMSCDMEPSDYLDDVAKALYEIDLRPDLTKKGTEKNNLTTYTIGFADDAINPNLPGVNPLLKNTADKGGGKFYFAGSASELSGSLQSAFQYITEDNSSSSSVATNSTQYQTDTLIYQALFNSGKWTGDLVAYALTTEDTAPFNGILDSIEDLNKNGLLDPGEDLNSNGILDSPEDTNGNGKLDAGGIGAIIWKASNLGSIPAHGPRNILTFDPDSGKGIEFKWELLNPSQKSILGTQPVVDYLRGNQADEKDNGGTYRNRVHVLGDIVNSDPLYVSHEDAGYAVLAGTEGSSYSGYVAKGRREMIYAAANDGMLHGFDGSNKADGGKEIFAYVPNAAITPTLVTLTNQSYSHRYIVDGSPQAGDVYFNSDWHTVLVGGLGAGGKALYALDITDPNAFDQTKVLWEFTETDLGYTLPQASIVKTANGQWAAIVANGYGSVSGKAVLYVINIQTGVVIKKIEADVSGGNGLSNSTVVDVDDDKIVDYVYAGDLKGNFWKFDISKEDPANWGVAYNEKPLFVAKDSANVNQPITSKPAASKAKGTGQTTGTMLYFGTGKYFEVGDNVVPASPQVQTFYAILDICDKSTSASCNGVVSSRSLLQEQTLIFEGNSGTTTLKDGVSTSGDVRVSSKCEVGYGTSIPTTTVSPCTVDTGRLGWFLELLSPALGAQGERVVSAPVVRHGVVIFPTLIPITAVCTPGGTSWLMELDQFTGARLAGTPVDLNNDGIVDDKDLIKIGDELVAASGFKSTVGIIDTPAIINCEDGLDCKYASGSDGEIMMKKESAPKKKKDAVKGNRTSWRQLM